MKNIIYFFNLFENLLLLLLLEIREKFPFYQRVLTEHTVHKLK